MKDKKKKRAVLQVVLEQQQRQLIQQYIRYMSLKNQKTYNISSFLSQSIMTFMLEKYKQEGLYNSQEK